MPTLITIENDYIAVAVAPTYGARITSLVDKASGRELITQGSESPNTGEEAAYLSAESVGWDECFPTISPWDGRATPYCRKLRDHGDLWGRPWMVDAATALSMKASFLSREFRFVRSLSLEGRSLVADYSATNLTREPLPYLWAQHCLLRVEPGERIELPELERVSATYLSLDGEILRQPSLPWTGSSLLPFPLDTVQSKTANFAGKFYASGVAGTTARIGRPGRWLEMSWDHSIDHLGIWITYGAWPGPDGHYEIALEPTNAPADHLGQAMSGGAAPLYPGERRDWRVTLTLVS
jgi:galactose mutarotase-like enzyme